MRNVKRVAHNGFIAKIPDAIINGARNVGLEGDRVPDRYICRRRRCAHGDVAEHAAWIRLLATDRRRVGPWVAVDVHAAYDGCVASAAAWRIWADLRNTGQQWRICDVAEAGIKRCSATVVQSYVCIISISIAERCCTQIIVDDAICKIGAAGATAIRC